ncbi:hypothetical protein MUN82_10725 [Hymenobacter aerilatus]|uniref:Uncharacterized protein n=1 Tax=Hymenobacter aerilatus TaxID=2932251 RepID=A0A8T9SZL7_9BACT|nr:DUF6770 family protein [Hymenobacter aerilatus]UOR07548.1 hypothetical protein MUN82_10725 [Hymenobacter aerilatus]
MLCIKRAALTACFALATSAAFAQTKTLDGIENMTRSALSPIYAGNEVKGYLMFGRGDKADRKTDNYILDFYDQDLGKVSNITIQKPANRFTLLKNSFNGTAFAFYFCNLKDETLEIETYDTSLKKLGSKVIEDLSKVDKMIIQNQIKQDGEASSVSGKMDLFPVPGHGFVRNSYTGMAKGYALVMYDDNAKAKWRLASDEKSKLYEMVSLTEATDKYILGIMMRKDGMLSKQISSSMIAINAATGKKVLDVPVETSKTEQLSLSSFTFDAEKREFVAVGEYYKLDDKPFVNKSQGFFIKRFSEAGKAVSTKNYGWQKEVMALMPAEAKASMEDNYVNYTQSIVKGANGKMYIVAEQFKIVGDGMGIALRAMGGKVSVSKGKIGNMLVFELDSEAKLSKVKFYQKDPSNATLPPGSGLMSAGLLGHVIKSQGDFDYQFMQRNDASTQFNVVYINFDKEKGEGTKRVIGNIAFGDNGQYLEDKINMASAANYSYLYPAKPGYVMIADYYKKKNQLGMKLVKLNI